MSSHDHLHAQRDELSNLPPAQSKQVRRRAEQGEEGFDDGSHDWERHPLVRRIASENLLLRDGTE